jgi:predicted metal-dependent phosphoesterase TrpH
MRIDFHVHTEYSKDCCIKLEYIEEILKEDKIIDAIAITDHNGIEAGLKLKKDFKNRIIVGEEIDTGEGEVVGYWLYEPIQNGEGIKKTLERIKNQGGITCIPHPFDRVRSKRINISKLMDAIDKVDMIEVFNSRNLFVMSNRRARQFALERRLLPIAGSDAHYVKEIGNAWVDCKALNSVADSTKVCQAIREGVIKGKRCNIGYHIKTKMLKFTPLFTREVRQLKTR